MCRVLYRFLALLAWVAVRSGCSKDLEIIVLRHQIAVLHRHHNRPALAEQDWALLGAVAAALSQPQRAGWLVTPQTLLGWHRTRIARHRTQPARAPGRPRTKDARRPPCAQARTADRNLRTCIISRPCLFDSSSLGVYRPGRRNKRRLSSVAHHAQHLWRT